jgi:hypothetical protein
MDARLSGKQVEGSQTSGVGVKKKLTNWVLVDNLKEDLQKLPLKDSDQTARLIVYPS